MSDGPATTGETRHDVDGSYRATLRELAWRVVIPVMLFVDVLAVVLDVVNRNYAPLWGSLGSALLLVIARKQMRSHHPRRSGGCS